MNAEKERDRQFTDERLSRVEENSDGWAITANLGSLFIPKYAGTPKVGDLVRYYGRGLGYPVRGVDIAGVEVYYDTAEQYEAKQKASAEARRIERIEEYEAHRDAFTERINSLPGPCQQRLFQFRERNPDFGWEFEAYELECSTIAARIAQAFERRETPITADEWFRKWREMKYDEQVAVCGPDTGWSGNMMGFANRQAYLLATAPDIVPKDHGALCGLVGCDGFKACDAYWTKNQTRK